MRIIVKCGEDECRTEFNVETTDPEWECPSCGHVIINRQYPFLTAKVMQARVEGDSSDWKRNFKDLLDTIGAEMEKRTSGELEGPPKELLIKGHNELKREHSNGEWRVLFEDLLSEGRKMVLRMEKEEESPDETR